MKKAAYAITTVLEMLLLIGAYVVNYFTEHKMGMARFVIYKNQGWERDLPLGTLKILSIVIIIALTAIVVILAVRKMKILSVLSKAELVIMMTLVVFSLYFTIFNSKEAIRAYYFMSPMIAFSALLQIAKTGTLLLFGKK